MRVSLIIPPSGFLLDELVFPTLGILKVAAMLEQASIPVSVLDLSGCEDVERRVSEHCDTYRPDTVGITATTPQLPMAVRIADHLLRSRALTRVILGGPHVTLMNASARQERRRGSPSRACRSMKELSAHVDVVLCGDGEFAIDLALSPDSPRLIDADDSQSRLFLHGSILDDLPFAARHLIDLNRYHYDIDGQRAQSLICQLGCPFGCRFCGGRQSPFLRRIRTRSTNRVIEEMRYLYQTYGTSGFMFFDDELNVNTLFMDLLQQMQDLQAELGADFRMRGFLKAELVTEPMVKAMYTAGFRKVLVGCESGHPRILENIRKVATVEQNTRCVDLLQSNGIAVKAAMSLGHPGETEKTVEATRRWLLDVQPAEFDVTIITVYPGTPYFDDAQPSGSGIWTYTEPRHGDRLHAYDINYLADSAFYKGTPGEYRSFVYTDALSAEALCALRDDVERDVRQTLKIPYPTAAAEIQFDHSMGQ